jgi:hypothetical protein
MIDPESAEADAALSRLWARDEAPDYDAGFSLAVSGRIGRRQILKEVGEVVIWAAPAAAITWAIWPSVSQAVAPVVQGAGQVGPVLVIVGATVFALWSAARLFSLPGMDLGALEFLLPRERLNGPDDGFR